MPQGMVVSCCHHIPRPSKISVTQQWGGQDKLQAAVIVQLPLQFNRHGIVSRALCQTSLNGIPTIL